MDIKITQLSATSTVSNNDIFIGQSTYTYRATGDQLKTFFASGLTYGNFYVFKGDGNTLPTAETGDKRIGIDSNGLLVTQSYDGSDWVLTDNINPKKTVTLDGGAGSGAVGYVDLLNIADDTIITKVEWLADSLTPDTGTPQVSLVLYDGINPDVLISGAYSAAELNSGLITDGSTDTTPASSQSLKLLIAGAAISGDLTIKITYF